MMNKIDRYCVMLYLTFKSAMNRIREDESGMEVMQVILLLGVGLVVIAALIAMWNLISPWVQQKLSDVLSI